MWRDFGRVGQREAPCGHSGFEAVWNVHNGVTICAQNLRGMGRRAMRIFGYLGIGFLIVWLFAPAPVAMADTAPVVATDATQSPPQPVAGEQDLLNLLD